MAGVRARVAGARRKGFDIAAERQRPGGAGKRCHATLSNVLRSVRADVIPPTPARAGTVWAELLVGQGA